MDGHGLHSSVSPCIHKTKALIHERGPIYISSKLWNTASDTLTSVTLQTVVILVAFIYKIETLNLTRLSKNDNIKIIYFTVHSIK